MSTRALPAEVLSDSERAAAGVALLLESLGLDVESERLRDTPRRVATSLAARLTPEPLPPLTLVEPDGYRGPIVMRDIPFHSLCEHHVLPFRGVAHIGYLPADRVAGLSAFVRVVEYFSRDLQLQERLTAQVADWIERELAPRGLGVVIDAEHLCMSKRGVGTPQTRTTTSDVRGDFSLAQFGSTGHDAVDERRGTP